MYLDPTGMNKCLQDGNKSLSWCSGGGYVSSGMTGAWTYIPGDSIAILEDGELLGLDSESGFWIFLEGGGDTGETANPYLVEISRQLTPLIKLSDCTGLAIANEVPLGSQIFGAPSPDYVGKGSRFLAKATSGNPQGTLISLPGTDAPGVIPWNYATNSQRAVSGLDAIGLPELADTVASLSSKLAGFSGTASKFLGIVGAAWSAGNVVHNTAACYSKPGG